MGATKAASHGNAVWQCSQFKAGAGQDGKRHFRAHAERERQRAEFEDGVADRLIRQSEARLNKKRYHQRQASPRLHDLIPIFREQRDGQIIYGINNLPDMTKGIAKMILVMKRLSRV